jgi:hypothetical protein
MHGLNRSPIVVPYDWAAMEILFRGSFLEDDVQRFITWVARLRKARPLFCWHSLTTFSVPHGPSKTNRPLDMD